MHHETHTTVPRGTRWLGAFLLVVVVAVGSACGSKNEQTTATSDKGGADRGAEIYTNKCASCHGADLRGTEKGPSHLSKVYEAGHHGDLSFRSAVANGAPQHHWCFGAMPAVPGLSEADVTAVIAYVRQQQAQKGVDEGENRCKK